MYPHSAFNEQLQKMVETYIHDLQEVGSKSSKKDKLDEFKNFLKLNLDQLDSLSLKRVADLLKQKIESLTHLGHSEEANIGNQVKYLSKLHKVITNYIGKISAIGAPRPGLVAPRMLPLPHPPPLPLPAIIPHILPNTPHSEWDKYKERRKTS